MRSTLLSFLLMLGLAALWGCSPSRPLETKFKVGNLRVEVTPVEPTYSLGRHGKFGNQERDTNAFLVRFRVSNLDPAACGVGIMTCSYNDHWKTDNPDVSVGSWSCDSNFPVLRILSGTNDYSGVLPLVVRPTAKGRQLLFHMAFTPATNFVLGATEARSQGTSALSGTYCSNEIRIDVTD